VSRREDRSDLANTAVFLLLANPYLRVVAVDLQLAQMAAGLAATHRIRGADAVYVATARALQMPLVTLDE
jgi:predicted nucleic acid-binding protein